MAKEKKQKMVARWTNPIAPIMFDEFRERDLRRKLECMPTQPITADTADAVPFGISLAVIEECARRFMSLEQMSYIVGMPPHIFVDAVERFPLMRMAYEHGLSRGAYLATGVIADAIDHHDVGVARYVLETKLGWRGEDAPSVHVHSGARAVVSIDTSHVKELGARQADLMGVAVQLPMPALVDRGKG